MTGQNIILEGLYYSGIHPVARPAVIEFSEQGAALTAGEISEKYSRQSLYVSPRTGRADRFINLPDGAQFQCADDAVLDTLPQESTSEGLVAWLEQRWGIALASVLITALMLLLGYFYGLPAAAKHIAYRIPIETEQALGKQALDWMDENEWLKPTQLAKEKQESIRNGFNILCSDFPYKDHYRLAFRSSTFIGPNAFALPGGTIVITDDMVKFAKSDEEVISVLAHEIGHEVLRHTMRSILQNSAVAVVAATVTSDAATLSAAVAGLPALLAQTKYSREFEAEADDYAFRLLKEKNYSPAAFASVMERLSKKYEEKMSRLSFISTHPITEERVKKARAAAR